MTTEEKKQESFNFKTPQRLVYADIMMPATYVKGKPSIVGYGKDAKYSATFLIDNTPKMVQQDGKDVDVSDLAHLKRAVITMLKAHNKTGKILKIGRLTEEQEAANSHIEVKVPWKDGNTEADKLKAKGKDGEAFRGKTTLKATSKFPPVLCLRENGVTTEYPAVKDDAGNYVQPQSLSRYFYRGAWAFPSLGLHWYKGDEGKPDGVSLYLNMLLFFKHDSRLGGSQKPATEVFKECIGAFSNEDPTGGAAVDELDDEIPF